MHICLSILVLLQVWGTCEIWFGRSDLTRGLTSEAVVRRSLPLCRWTPNARRQRAWFRFRRMVCDFPTIAPAPAFLWNSRGTKQLEQSPGTLVEQMRVYRDTKEADSCCAFSFFFKCIFLVWGVSDITLCLLKACDTGIGYSVYNVHWSPR